LFEFLVIDDLRRRIVVAKMVQRLLFAFKGRRMNDNVIKFKKREPVKPPRQTPIWVKRMLVILGVAAAFVLAYVYFAVTGGGPSL
jgi:hypothetical protein